LGEVHQSNQILPISNSFSQLWELQTVLFKDGLYKKDPLKLYHVQKCLGEL